jgi:phosphoribosyl-ATP pyrophosphohydrolase/phosphoribosyl-AMP cyclohydrolase
MKGERSGDVLELVSVETDCDGDALLVQAIPHGPTCHLKRTSCFAQAPGSVLGELEAIVAQRARERPQGSYTTTLFEAGPKRIAQKIGEEGVETALALLAEADEALLGEVADLFFHTLVGLQARGLSLAEVGRVLEKRRLAKQRVSD